MYSLFKIVALVSVIAHLVMHQMTVTDYFNRIFIAVSVLVLLLPKKWWGLYILPLIIIISGLVVAGYAFYLRIVI